MPCWYDFPKSYSLRNEHNTNGKMELIKEFLQNDRAQLSMIVIAVLVYSIKGMRNTIIQVLTLFLSPLIPNKIENSEETHKTLKNLSLFFIILSSILFIYTKFQKGPIIDKKDLFTDGEGNPNYYSISKITIEFNAKNISDTLPSIRSKAITQGIVKANGDLTNKYPDEWITLIKKDIDNGLLQKAVRDSLSESFFTNDFKDHLFIKINETIKNTNSMYTYSVSVSLAKGSNIKAIIDQKCKEQIKKAILNKVAKNCVTTIGFDELYSGCSKNWYFLPYISGCKQGTDCGKVYFESGHYNPAPFSEVVSECISDITKQYKFNIYISGYTDPDSIKNPIQYDGKGFYNRTAGIYLKDTTKIGVERIPNIINTNLQLSYARAFSLYKLIKSKDSTSNCFYTGCGIKTSQTNHPSMRTVIIQFKCK